MTCTIRIDDLSANGISEVVILALARVSDQDPLELSPLGESVNPIALDMLFEDDSFTGRVDFQYEGYELTLTSDGDIMIT